MQAVGDFFQSLGWSLSRALHTLAYLVFVTPVLLLGAAEQSPA